MKKKIMAVWRTYGRAVVAVVVTALVALSSALTDHTVTHAEWIQIGIQATSAAAVWYAPNLPASGGVKTGFAVLLAVLNAWATIPAGLNVADVVNLILAGLGVIGVGMAPSISLGELQPAPPPR